MTWGALALLALASAAAAQGPETCLSGDDEPYLMFGDRTAYTFVTTGRGNSRIHEVAGCTPQGIWLLYRHGSHNPEADELQGLQQLQNLKDNILATYRHRNSRNSERHICASDVNLLDQWKWNPRQNLTFAGDLTSDGYMTTQQLAQSWRQKFPTLFTDNRHDYLFKYVNEDHKSSTSFQAFTEGLFGAQAGGYGIPKQNDEKLLQIDKNCPAWRQEVGENNDTLTQRQIFESKQEYKDMITNISSRLGFNYDIEAGIVLRMYQMCRYNKAWDVVALSPWCVAFTKEDLQRLEYAEDLETYYKYGYGSPQNQQLGCTLVKDMMDFLKKQVDNPESIQKPSTVVQMSSAPALLLTLAALGAHRGAAPLTGDNYRTQQNRKWTTSTMTPFNGNIAAVLFKCNRNNNLQLQDQYQVLFMENEQQMYLDGCRVGLCDWSLVKQRFGNVADSCDLKFCNSANSFTGFMAFSVALVTFALRF